MRMGPFSDSKIIELLNRYFVAAHLANEDYESGAMGSDQRTLLNVVRRSAKRQGLPFGRVQIYVVDGEGKVLDVLPLKRALDTKTLLTSVQNWIEEYELSPRKAPPPSNVPRFGKAVGSGELLLRIASGYKTLEKITTEDHVLLEKTEWEQLTGVGQTSTEWVIDDGLAKKILIHLYPYAQNFDLSLEQIQDAELRASVLRNEGDVLTVALVGRLSMSHVMYVKKGRHNIQTDLVGYVISTPNGKPTIKLSTSGAKYGAFPFDALIESVSSRSLE